MWKKKKVVVTGAGGFIGSHLVERLISYNADVTAMVRYNSRSDFGHLDRIPPAVKEQINIVQGDLKDPDVIKKIIKNQDVLFHLGAIIAIPYSYINPREIIETNILGTINVLTAAREQNVEKIIHTSTSEVYGTAKYIPIDENHPLQGQSPYSASKIAADEIARSFYLSYHLPIATIRPFNTYGPRQSARAIIPTIITQASKNKTISIGDGKPTRDFTFVEDTISGFIKIAEKKESIGETINIGSSTEISINDLAKKILKLMNKDIRIVSKHDRKRPSGSEVYRLCADNRKAKRILGWTPTITLEKGLQKTITWIVNNIDQYKVNGYTI